MRIIDAKKSEYYDAAFEDFERSAAMLREGWGRRRLAGVADDLRAEHHRKTGFMSGFEEVAAGLGPGENPSFLERAKVRSGVLRAEHKE